MKSIPFPWRVIILLVAFALAASLIQAQDASAKQPTLVNATITATGELEIIPSATSSPHDFDFLAGKWDMHNWRLKTRLNQCTEWIEYESTSDNPGPILNGIGNMDLFRTSFNPVSKEPFEGLTVRLFNPKTKLWSIYWIDSNTGVMDAHPVVGSFEGNVGKFYAKDTFHDKPILVMFNWDRTDKDNPVWSQSFSPDNGLTWEMNHTNVLHRVK